MCRVLTAAVSVLFVSAALGILARPHHDSVVHTAIASDVEATAPFFTVHAAILRPSVHIQPSQQTATTTTVPPPTTRTRPTATPGTIAGYGCGPALAWLRTHAAPGFIIQCPGYAEGHQAMTCYNVAGICPGYGIIVIHVPCPAAYMNEAWNSWIVSDRRSGSYDPYGYCH